MFVCIKIVNVFPKTVPVNPSESLNDDEIMMEIICML